MSNEIQEVGKLCRRYARQIWREQPELSVDEMLQRNEIVWVALNGKRYERMQILNWILPDSTPHEELDFFNELDVWTIEEAAALWRDVNPFIFLQSFKKHNPSFWNQAFHPVLREKYHALLEKLKRSAIKGDVTTTRNGDQFYITPHDFYVWATKNTDGPLGDRPESFFAKLEGEWAVRQVEINQQTTKVNEKRVEIQRILNTIKIADPDFSQESMPGRKLDFQNLCIMLHKRYFTVASETFNDYLKGICKFSSGARETDYYKKIAIKLG